MRRSETIKEIAIAMAKAQGKIEGARKLAFNKNPHVMKKYADLDAHWDAIRGPLSENGIAVFQPVRTEWNPEGTSCRVVVTTLLVHSSGEWMEEEITIIPMRQEAGKGWVPSYDPQTIVGACTYGRRGGLSGMVGTSPEDDDGNAASGRADETERSGNGTKAKETKEPEAAKAKNGQADNKEKFLGFMKKFSERLSPETIAGLLADKEYKAVTEVDKYEDQTAIYHAAKALYDAKAKKGAADAK